MKNSCSIHVYLSSKLKINFIISSASLKMGNIPTSCAGFYGAGLLDIETGPDCKIRLSIPKSNNGVHYRLIPASDRQEAWSRLNFDPVSINKISSENANTIESNRFNSGDKIFFDPITGRTVE